MDVDIGKLVSGLTYFKDEGLWISQIFIIVFSVLIFNFFFFQAEDGIRDISV